MYLLANTLSNIGFLLALGIMVLMLLRRSNHYFSRKGRTKIEGLVRIDRPPAPKRWTSNIDSPEVVSKYEVQLQETMRELSAQLDNKMVCLQVLLRQANEKIRRLEELQQMDGSGETSSDKAGAVASDATSSTGELTNPLHQQIFTLAEQGFSPVTIAHRVAQPLREVESILRLRTGN